MNKQQHRAIVKICGITHLGDARLAMELGADWLGFNFYKPSPRYIEPEKAAEILRHLPKRTIAVGLFVNEDIDRIITLCGSEDACPTFPGRVVRLHWPLPDPAAVEGEESEKLQAFRRVRDELERRLQVLFERSPA